MGPVNLSQLNPTYMVVLAGKRGKISSMYHLLLLEERQNINLTKVIDNNSLVNGLVLFKRIWFPQNSILWTMKSTEVIKQLNNSTKLNRKNIRNNFIQAQPVRIQN